jgi:hypothetical protein
MMHLVLVLGPFNNLLVIGNSHSIKNAYSYHNIAFFKIGDLIQVLLIMQVSSSIMDLGSYLSKLVVTSLMEK